MPTSPRLLSYEISEETRHDLESKFAVLPPATEEQIGRVQMLRFEYASMAKVLATRLCRPSFEYDQAIAALATSMHFAIRGVFRDENG